jgi:hypothetical protein
MLDPKNWDLAYRMGLNTQEVLFFVPFSGEELFKHGPGQEEGGQRREIRRG